VDLRDAIWTPEDSTDTIGRFFKIERGWKPTLTSIRIKIEVSKNDRRWQSLPSVHPKIIFAALIVSLLLHVASWLGARMARDPIIPLDPDRVKIRSITNEESRILDATKKEIAKAKRIIETKQTETAPPKSPTSLGAQDHFTAKETRLSERKLAETRAQDPASKSVNNPVSTPQISPKNIEKKTEHAIVPRVIAAPGQLSVRKNSKKPETAYEKLLPQKAEDIFAPKSGGFIEPLDKNIAEGDRVDMNTSSFKYISYFTGLRKQIEMVWIYPSEAVRRGLQGAVQLEMVIESDGRVSRVRIVQSSGYKSLDENMVKTIKLASPFAPLPKTWGKDRLVVTGSFHYILTFASH
jgi:TonB family protein